MLLTLRFRAEIYTLFRNLLPPLFLPESIRSRFPSTFLSNAIPACALFLVFFLPVGGQYGCVVTEMLTWQYAITHEWEPIEGNENVVKSKYVDDHRKLYPFGLQNEDVKLKYKEESGGVIYVHAQGKFGDEKEKCSENCFRKNLGPEVFLPYQPMLYIFLMAICVLLAIGVFFRLVNYRVKWEKHEKKLLG